MEPSLRAQSDPVSVRVKSVPTVTKDSSTMLFKEGLGKNAEQGKAERIADYFYTYSMQGSASARPGARPLTGNTAGLQPKPSPTSTSTKGKRTIIIDHSAEDRLQAKLRQAAKEINALENDIYQGRSDKLELKRDLHTYEYEASKAVGLERRLEEIAATTETLPGFVAVAGEISARAHNLFDEIQSEFVELTKPAETDLRETLTRPLGLPLRIADTSHHLRTVYKGADKISGQTCIIHILGNKALMDLRVNALTPQKQQLSLQLKQKAVSDVDTRRYLKTLILPYLFIKWNKHGQMDLALDRDVGKRIGSMLLRLQGSGRTTLLHMKEDAVEVSFTSPYTEAALLVPIEKITEAQSIFSLSYKQLKNILREKLMVMHGPERLVWVQDGSKGVQFRSKEKTSKLMDTDYLSERLHDFVQILVAKEEISVDGHKYLLELYAHKAVEKLRITGRDHYEEISADSSLMKLVKNLQFSLCQNHIRTLLCSLELQHAVRTLFGLKMSLSHSSSAFVNSSSR